jgi:hypothetical protein
VLLTGKHDCKLLIWLLNGKSVMFDATAKRELIDQQDSVKDAVTKVFKVFHLFKSTNRRVDKKPQCEVTLTPYARSVSNTTTRCCNAVCMHRLNAAV